MPPIEAGQRELSCLWLLRLKMEKKSWLCTLITQFFLFVALFVAINIGRPQKKPEYQISRDGRAPFDLYFISVRGGSRSLQEQFRLLEQVENVLKTYKAKFVVDISELGEEDPLMQNATHYLQSLKVPWYTTNALKRQGADYFLKQVKIAEEKTLDLIALDTGSLKDPSSGTGRDQLHWLTRILETSNGMLLLDSTQWWLVTRALIKWWKQNKILRPYTIYF